MGGAVGLLHVVGWGLFALAAVRSPDGAVSFGVAVTAYTLGMRHAFDADHIAAIDNTTRKLREDGETPFSVGLWFSLGHSTIVFALACALAAMAGRIYGSIAGPTAFLHSVGGIMGTLVSALFLYAIASLNLKSLIDTLRAAGGGKQPPVFGGPLFRIFGRLLLRIRRPSGMYPVGLLFGLGFDTATEVALLATTAGAAMGPLPWYGVLALPCLFAAGMSLCDSVDGISMQYAYDWSLLQPRRRLLWNTCVTGLSVAVAFVVGTIELLTLMGGAAEGGTFGFLHHLNLGYVGMGIALVLLLGWLFVLVLWRERKPEGPRAGPRRPGRRCTTE